MKTFFTVAGFLAVLFSSPRVAAQNVLPGYVGYWASPKTSIIILQEALPLSTQELQLRRNEIFARYGRAFETPAIQAHFNAQPWYRPVPSYTDAWLSFNDRSSVQLLFQLERPSLPAATVRALLLRNVEYFDPNGYRRITITGSGRAQITEEFQVGGGYTPQFREYHTDVSWDLKGDWLVAIQDGFVTRSITDELKQYRNRYFFRLDHNARTIVEMHGDLLPHEDTTH